MWRTYGEDEAWDASEIASRGDVTVAALRQQGRDGGCLIVMELERERASFVEMRGAILDKATDDGESIRAAIERGVRVAFHLTA